MIERLKEVKELYSKYNESNNFFPIEDYYRTRVRGKQFRTWTNRLLNQLKKWEDKKREKRKMEKSISTRKRPTPSLDRFLLQ